MSRVMPTSAADTAASIDRLHNALAEREQQLASLEAERGTIALAGGDIDALHIDLLKLGEEIKSLRAGLALAKAAHDAALTEEGERALEAEAHAVRDKQAPALADALRALASAALELIEAAESIECTTREIEHFNAKASKLGRDDLTLPPASIRAQFLDELGGLSPAEVPAAMVVRNGESDEEHYGRVRAKLAERAKARPNRGEKPADFRWREHGADFAKRAFVGRAEGEDEDSYEGRLVASIARHLNVSPFLGMAGSLDSSPEETVEEYRKRVWDAAADKLWVHRKGESDAAFAARQLRARMKATAGVDASDPLAAIIEGGIEALQRHGLGKDSVQLKRDNPKPISARSLYGRNVLTDPAALVLYGERHAQSIRRRQDVPTG